MSIQARNSNGELLHVAGLANVDAILSPTSKNAIQNKAVYNALKDKLEKATTDLIYYYTVNDVYNKSEVRALIGAVETLTMEVVSSLPVSDISTTTIYLLKPTGSNVYDEYVYINDAWVKIGTTDMDLSGYMLTADFNVAIADYFTKAEINNLLNSYYTKAEIDADFYDKDTVDDLIADVSADIDDTAADIYEVMEKNGAKNLLGLSKVATSESKNGVTLTKNSDGSFTLNGTATTDTFFKLLTDFPTSGKYIFSGMDTGKYNNTYWIWLGNISNGNIAYYQGAMIYSDTKDSIPFDITQLKTGGGTAITIDNLCVWITVKNGTTFSNKIIYPMIRLASDTDSTYQPYAETNYQLTQRKMSYADNGILGAKNLIPYPYADTTKTVNGVTFTDLGDGTVKVNGTATATTLFTFAGTSKQFLKAGTYILSGCPDVDSGAYIQVYVSGSGTTIGRDRYENEPYGTTFTLTQAQVDTQNIVVGIALLSGTQVSNAVFRPMLRLASDTDSTYQPYAMTNKELTQPEVKVLTLDSRYTSAGVVYYVKVGRVVVVSLETVVLTSSATNSTPICTLPIPIARSNNTKIRACGWTTTKSVALIEVDATSGALTFGGTIPSTSEGIFGQIVYIS